MGMLWYGTYSNIFIYFLFLDDESLFLVVPKCSETAPLVPSSRHRSFPLLFFGNDRRHGGEGVDGEVSRTFSTRIYVTILRNQHLLGGRQKTRHARSRHALHCRILPNTAVFSTATTCVYTRKFKTERWCQEHLLAAVSEVRVWYQLPVNTFACSSVCFIESTTLQLQLLYKQIQQ